MAGRILLGVGTGLLLAGLTWFGIALAFGAELLAASIIGLVAGTIGAVYSAIAFAKKIYSLRFSSILGYVLDMTWSLLNTTAALLVWLPISAALGGGMLPPDANTRRSGTFVYKDNPRGGGYDATTIGTVVAGGWDAHEETHVWQARIFGPFYLLSYGLCWVLVLLFRAVTGKVKNIGMESYARICFEDWAYWGTKLGTPDYRWGQWVGGFFLTLLFILLLVFIPVGFVTETPALWGCGFAGIVIYAVVRAFTPPSTTV
jgi:hypothetical protein